MWHLLYECRYWWLYCTIVTEAKPYLGVKTCFPLFYFVCVGKNSTQSCLRFSVWYSEFFLFVDWQCLPPATDSYKKKKKLWKQQAFHPAFAQCSSVRTEDFHYQLTCQNCLTNHLVKCKKKSEPFKLFAFFTINKYQNCHRLIFSHLII